MNQLFLDKLNSVESTWAQYDLDTVEQMYDRISQNALYGSQPLNYSDLISGLTLHVDGDKHVIDLTHWTGLDRRVLGDYMFEMDKQHYPETGVLASILVISKSDGMPSEIVQRWFKEIGLYSGDFLPFWAKESKLAVDYFTAQRKLASTK